MPQPSQLAEKCLVMPHSYLPCDHRAFALNFIDPDVVKSVRRADYGLSEDKFVFANFSNLSKICPTVFAMWMRVLKRIPNSQLWLLGFSDIARVNLLRQARENYGVRDDQIVFSPLVSREEQIKRAYLADLFLDTFVLSCQTTAADVLWAGTPIITFPSEKMGSRTVASLLNAVGLGDQLICSSATQYEELAVGLAEDPDRLYAMRQHLERTRLSSAAFDTARWVTNYENGLLRIYKRYEQGHTPEHTEIEDKGPIYVVDDSIL